jgi:hypothetical protein
MKTFLLERYDDVSGISGTGVVAEGVVFSDGTVVLRWIGGAHHTTAVHDDLHSVETIHGHHGATKIVFTDD